MTARAAIEAAARARMDRGSPTVIADWGALAESRPELTRDDGVHLADADPPDGQLAEDPAADAWTGVMWDGVARCAEE